MRAGRPVKWVETRTEHLSASLHGNEVFFDAELAVKKDGTILGLKARALHDEGALYEEGTDRSRSTLFAMLPWDIPLKTSAWISTAWPHNKCPVGPNRSYGKMQQCFLVERLLDMAARRLEMDPVEIRYKNFVQPHQMPYESPTGCILDGGDYPGAMKKVLEMVNYPKVRAEQAKLRKSGKYLGIGIALGMDACPVNSSIQRMMNPKAQASGGQRGGLGEDCTQR